MIELYTAATGNGQRPALILEELGLAPANYNGGGQLVVAGELPALAALAGNAPAGARVIPLQVAGAFHTPYMQPAQEEFAPVAETFEMRFEIRHAAAPYRTIIMVSKDLHCLNDLLFRASTGSLGIEVAAVVSNHRDAEPMAASYGVPFHHVPVTAETKPQAEERLLELVGELDVHLVVLARYMQILSDALCRELAGHAINIHHSFLPSFKGAKPYHQAFDRGVKLVGATAHYVTGDLDEGPIIEQDVIRVDHGYTQAQLVSAGRDVETQVLARAVRWHAESRVLLNGHRTVVFR